MPVIIETTDNRLYRVEETGDFALAHVWFGVRVKRTRDGFKDCAGARRELVRKEGARLVQPAPARAA